MKHLLLLCSLAIVAGALTGCSGEDGKIEVDAAASPLTANGNDALFTIRVVEAREGGYALDALSVKLVIDDADPVSVTCNANDVNGNGKLDTSDKLVCAEGAANQFGAELAGKEIDVELSAKIDGEDTKIGSATWTPPK